MPVTRKQIVDEARTWLGTPFAHQGRHKGAPGGPDPYSIGACDCIGMPLSIGEYFRLVDKNGDPFLAHQNLNYPRQPMNDAVHEECERRLIPKPLEELLEGDLVTVKMPSVACHVGIVTRLYVGTKDECLGIIHALSPAGRVVETVLDAKLRRHLKGAFTFPGVNG